MFLSRLDDYCSDNVGFSTASKDPGIKKRFRITSRTALFNIITLVTGEYSNTLQPGLANDQVLIISAIRNAISSDCSALRRGSQVVR